MASNLARSSRLMFLVDDGIVVGMGDPMAAAPRLMTVDDYFATPDASRSLASTPAASPRAASSAPTSRFRQTC
jgi:hypothetical protein